MLSAPTTSRGMLSRASGWLTGGIYSNRIYLNISQEGIGYASGGPVRKRHWTSKRAFTIACTRLSPIDEHTSCDHRLGNMAWASSSKARSLGARSIPLLTAVTVSYGVYSYHASPIRNDEAEIKPNPPAKKPLAYVSSSNPYTPVGWGSNRYMTLIPDPLISTVKKPTPLAHLGSTPLRDLVIAEKYGACVDARGDCWMWGAGYDPSGQLGRSLRGKVSAPSLLVFWTNRNRKSESWPQGPRRSTH